MREDHGNGAGQEGRLACAGWAQINFVEDNTEWKGTDVVLEIANKDGKTELRFTHVGLVPTIQCYGKCAGAWGFYINERLRSLITTRKGDPNPEE